MLLQAGPAEMRDSREHEARARRARQSRDVIFGEGPKRLAERDVKFGKGPKTSRIILVETMATVPVALVIVFRARNQQPL